MEGKNKLKKIYQLVNGQPKLRHTYLYEQGTEESEDKLLKEEIYNDYGDIKTRKDFIASTELNVEYLIRLEDLPHQIHTITNLITGEVTKREIKGIQYSNAVIIYDDVTGKATISLYNNMDTKLLLVKTVLDLNDQRVVSHMVYSYTSYRHYLDRMAVLIPAKKEFRYFYSKNGLVANVTENDVSILTDGNYTSFMTLVIDKYGSKNYDTIKQIILTKPYDNYEVVQKRPNSNTIVAINPDYKITVEDLPHGVIMVTETIGNNVLFNIIMPDGNVYLHKNHFTLTMKDRTVTFDGMVDCNLKEYLYSRWDKDGCKFDTYQKHTMIYDVDGNLLEEEFIDL